MEEKNMSGNTMENNESSAVIRLYKSEIENVIRALILSIRVSEAFALKEDISSFVKVKDDFLKIKNQLVDKEESYAKDQQIKKKASAYRETREECD